MTAEPEVIEGHFWRPGEEEERFYGRLEYDLEHGVRAHFVDTNLIGRAPDGPVQPGVIDVLHGEALGGTPLTLQGVYPGKWRMIGMRGSGDDVIDAVVRRMLRGAHVPDGEEPRAAIAGASLRGLREFLIGGIVDGGPLPIPGDGLSGEVLNVDLAEGVSLLLSVNRQPTLGRVDRHSEVVASAQWTCDPPVPLDDLEERWIDPLRDLILFATRAPSHLLSLGLHADPGDPRSSIGVLQRPHPRPREVADVYALALNLGDSEDPPRLIGSWFALRERIGPVWGLFFAALDRPESLLEDRLLGLLAFAEGYDRVVRESRPLTDEEEKAARKAIRKALPDKRVRGVYSGAINHANSWTQRERLDHLIGRAMESLGGWWEIDPDLLSSQLSDTRNWLVHWGGRGADTATDGQGMVELVRALIVVLYVNVLRELGLDAEAAARVIGSGWRLEPLPSVGSRDGPRA